jgi:hypothetical protein
MSGLLSLIVHYWKLLVGLSVSVSSACAAWAWLFKKFKSQREKLRDSKVLEALGGQWTGNRPFTGAGETGVRAAEIAERVSLGRDEVADSLERLAVQRKARKGEGTLSDSAPYWYPVRR